MAYRNLKHFIDTLEKKKQLIRIKEYINPELEITEITDRISKVYGPALLFENTGKDFPLLINSMGNYERMCLALGVESLDDITKEIEQLFKTLTAPKENIWDKLKMLPTLGSIASWLPKVKQGRGECQEVVMQDPDITSFPVLKCWPEDGGNFITLPIVNTKDPVTGVRNTGMYRMQVFGPKLTGMHWHKHKVAARHYQEYKKLGQRMPIAVALGGDPVYTYAATAPLPDNVDEYMLAGFLRKKKVELVQCLTQDLQVPADADIIIEGYVDPSEDWIWEGPFGDHTGYYSLADWYPKFHITCITHRKNAVYPTTIVGIPPQEDVWIGKATERLFLAPIKMAMLPEVLDMVLPMEGVFHNLVIVKIKKDYAGQAVKVMNALFGAGQMMFTKMMIVVDGPINIHNSEEVANYISQNIDPQTDITLFQGPMDVLDHASAKWAFGGKMGIDATKKYPEELRENDAKQPVLKNINKAVLKERFSEIRDINDSLLSLGISLLFISVEKTKKGQIEEINNQLFAQEELQNIKIVVYLDHTVDITCIADAVWRFSNNVDPKRDSFIVKAKNEGGISHIGLDGTRKTKALDGFDREWPNILASNQETIEQIDKIWSSLNLGAFIPSPSLKYGKQLYKGGAVVEEI